MLNFIDVDLCVLVTGNLCNHLIVLIYIMQQLFCIQDIYRPGNQLNFLLSTLRNTRYNSRGRHVSRIPSSNTIYLFLGEISDTM